MPLPRSSCPHPQKLLDSFATRTTEHDSAGAETGRQGVRRLLEGQGLREGPDPELLNRCLRLADDSGRIERVKTTCKKQSSNPSPVADILSLVVLVGTYKGNQLKEWPGWYCWPLDTEEAHAKSAKSAEVSSCGDAKTDRDAPTARPQPNVSPSSTTDAISRVTELWLFQGTREQRNYKAEFVGIKTRRADPTATATHSSRPNVSTATRTHCRRRPTPSSSAQKTLPAAPRKSPRNSRRILNRPTATTPTSQNPFRPSSPQFRPNASAFAKRHTNSVFGICHKWRLF